MFSAITNDKIKTTEDKQIIKRKRVLRAYIEAAGLIADNEGLDAITIKKVSELTGYSYATFYNYFDNNLSELLTYTAVHSISNYLKELTKIVFTIKDSRERYIQIWRAYCMNSFACPSCFTYAYASDKETMDNVQAHIADYCKLFPETLVDALEGIDLSEIPKQEKLDYKNMLCAVSAKDHDHTINNHMITNGLLTPEALNDILEFGVLLHRGILHELMFGANNLTPSENTELFFKYHIPCLDMLIEQTQNKSK